MRHRLIVFLTRHQQRAHSRLVEAQQDVRAAMGSGDAEDLVWCLATLADRRTSLRRADVLLRAARPRPRG